MDIGSGTGQSSIALAEYCEEVYGIEPNKSMLDQSLEHKQVHYSFFDKKRFDFDDDYFDITTLAGSLYYAKSQYLLDELVRVCKSGANVLVYDFDLSLDEIINQLLDGNYKKKILHTIIKKIFQA